MHFLFCICSFLIFLGFWSGSLEQAITFCPTFINLILLAYDFFGLCNLTVHDFLYTDNNFLHGRQLPLEGKFVAGVQEPDGCSHGGVAVPVAVLFG